MINRTMLEKLNQMIKVFPVVIISGARQVGKSTLAMTLVYEKKYNYLTLGNPLLREEAKRDPQLFLQRHKNPLIIDEIQYAPELLIYIKMIVDERRLSSKDNKGLYILIGSQMFKTMLNVSESLAGRIGILQLYGLSNNEIIGREEKPFIPTYQFISQGINREYQDVIKVFDKIFRGSFPELYNTIEIPSIDFYSSYVQTYLEKDIKDIIAIKDEMKFLRIVSLLAARTGQELIYTELAKAGEIDIKTVQSWVSVLISSGLAVLLSPFNSSLSKRIIKRPKFYFMDTGLACYLARFSDPLTLEMSNMAGSFFETYVISEIIKSYENNGRRFEGYYYRDNDQNEIDLIILENGMIHPIEIKKSSNPSMSIINKFKILERFNLPLGEGGVICLTDNIVSLDKKNNIIPLKCI